MRLLMLTRYARTGASSRLRSFQFEPLFNAAGIETNIQPLFDDEYISALSANKKTPLKRKLGPLFNRYNVMQSADSYDAVWIEKEALPFVPWLFENLAGRKMKHYIVDYDDALFHRYDKHTNPVIRAVLGKKIDGVMAGASAIVAGNSYLANRARKAGATNIEIVPTVVDPVRYRATPPPRNAFRIGWIGSPSTSKYLSDILPALERAKRELDAKIALVGASSDTLVSLEPDIRKWSEVTEAESISDFSVGIMPLPDTPWEQGKCGYKLLQYMASGKPVLASPVGMNCDIVTPGVNGYFATTNDEWFERFAAMKNDHKTNEKMGLAGRKMIDTEFNITAAADKIINVINQFR